MVKIEFHFFVLLFKMKMKENIRNFRDFLMVGVFLITIQG
jgi:hypothetical protein